MDAATAWFGTYGVNRRTKYHKKIESEEDPEGLRPDLYHSSAEPAEKRCRGKNKSTR
jgi:hypothetical protein